MKLRLATPTALVDLAGIKELAGIKADGEALQIGALTTHAAVAASRRRALVAARCWRRPPRSIGDPQVRNRGTIGGSLAHADPARGLSDRAHRAGRDGRDGRRRFAHGIPADGFFKGLFTTRAGAGRDPHRGARADLRQGHGRRVPEAPPSGLELRGRGRGRARRAEGRQVRAGEPRRGRRVREPGARPVGGSRPHRPGARRSRVRRGRGQGRGSDQADLGDLYASGEFRMHLATVLARRALAQAVARAKR